MRYLSIALIMIITAVVLTFSLQNISSVTIIFLTSSFTLPLSVLVFGVYFLGMFTAGLVLRAMRNLLRGARENPPAATGHPKNS